MEIQRQRTSLCGVQRGVSLPGLVLSHIIGNPTVMRWRNDGQLCSIVYRDCR